MFWQFCYFLLAIRYCIVNNRQDQCNCYNYPLITAQEFNNNLIESESIVELFFCTNYSNMITINQQKRIFSFNADTHIEVTLNMSDYSHDIGLSFYNTNARIQNIPQNELITRSLYMYRSFLELPNPILVSPSFTADYQGYSNFNKIFAKEFTLINFYPQQFTQNITLEVQAYDLDPQTISIQYLDNCQVYFENYSVILANDIYLTVQSQMKMKANLYFSGSEYYFDTNYDMYGTKFIQTNIYSMDTGDPGPVDLYFNGSFPGEISEENVIRIGSFPSRVLTNIHIQTTPIPLSLDFYQGTQIFYYHNDTTIYGSIFLHDAQMHNISSSSDDGNLTLRAKSVTRVDDQSFLNINPNFTLILEQYTNHHYIVGNRQSVYYQTIKASPGFDSLTHLYPNAKFYVDAYPSMTRNGLSINTIFGSFSYENTSKNLVYLFFPANNEFDDLYFYRSVLENRLDLVCNKVRFNCNDWIIEFDNKTGIHFDPICGFNSNSLYCLSIQANNDLVTNISQDIFVGDTLMQNSYDSLATEESNYFANIIDEHSRQFKINIETDITIDLNDFQENSIIYINSHQTNWHDLNLIIQNADDNKQFEKVVIENCNLSLIGEKIRARNIVFYNCLIYNMENLSSIQLDTTTLSIPLSLYSNGALNNLKYSSLSLFIDKADVIQILFNSTSVTVDGVYILNDKFDNLHLYPLKANYINYVVAENTGTVKGINLNFSSYEGIDFLRINRYVELLFTGNWANVRSVDNPFTFDFSNTQTTLPNFPDNIVMRILFDGGNVQYNSNKPLEIQNPVILKENFQVNYNMTNSIISFSDLSFTYNGSVASNRTITSNLLRIEKKVSLSSTSLSANHLILGSGSNLNVNNALSANILQINFEPNDFPLIITSTLSTSSIILNFENHQNISDFSFLIGEKSNFLCQRNLNCSDVIPKISIISSETNVTNQTIQNSYQFGCSLETYDHTLCLYASLQKDIEFVQPSPKKKKVPAWVIVISILIPLIVITIIAIIVAVVCMKKKYGNGAPEEPKNKNASPSKPRRQKVPIPIPPRKTLRPNPYDPNQNSLDEIENTEARNHDAENPARLEEKQNDDGKTHTRRSRVRKNKPQPNIKLDDQSVSSNSGNAAEETNQSAKQLKSTTNNARTVNTMKSTTLYSNSENDDDVPQVTKKSDNSESIVPKTQKQDLQTIQTDDSDLFQYDF